MHTKSLYHPLIKDVLFLRAKYKFRNCARHCLEFEHQDLMPLGNRHRVDTNVMPKEIGDNDDRFQPITN